MKNSIMKYDFTSFLNETLVKGKSHKLTQVQILDFIINNNYSAVKFSRNRRLKKNAQRTNVIVLDIDDIQLNNKSLIDVGESISHLNHIVATTRSHQQDKHGIICDRYRIIIFTKDEVISGNQYKDYIYSFGNKFSLNFDKKAVDIGRLYFKSQKIVSFNFQGKNFEIIETNKTLIIDNAKDEQKFEYRLANCEIPSFLSQWITKFNNLGKYKIQKREKFVRFLIAQKYLLVRNPIPQETVAEFLNIERITLSSWIKEFEKYKWLRIVSNEYGKGWKSKDYAVNGDLLNFMMAHYHLENKRDCFPQLQLPTAIKDGEWHNDLYHFSFYFSADSDNTRFLDWIKTLPGWDKKTRYAQAVNAFLGMKEQSLT